MVVLLRCVCSEIPHVRLYMCPIISKRNIWCLHTVEDSHTPLCEIIHMFASEGVFQSWLFPVAGTLTRAPPGSDQFSVWDVKETHHVKVVSAKNTNVAENHRVRAH